MIKVLVVDDDKLVRKGLISAMPWNDFGMQVTGEANNGQKALEFLESQPVDLLLTDLAMPVMSGVELLRIARKRYPRLHMVVLTLHQDFEYIQEALRLGAIDYIAKVQLERERFDEVLGRIAARINEQREQRRKPLPSDETVFELDHGFVLMSLERDPDRNWPQEWGMPADETMLEVERNCWLWLAAGGEQRQWPDILPDHAGKKPRGMLLAVSGLAQRSWKEIQRWIRGYMENVIFYEYRPDRKMLPVSMKEPYETLTAPDEAELNRVKESWLLSSWVHHDRNFEKLLADMKSLRLRETQLMGLLYSLVMEWNRFFDQTQLGKIQMIDSIHCWYDVEQWLGGLRQSIRESSGQAACPQDITDCMAKAVRMLHTEIDKQLTAAELAQRLNLSRSYFSQCFKEMTGKTFNDYSRSIRIEKAKDYLQNTNKTILWVAEQTGYSDEKYFSRIFREFTGVLPSEYRQTRRKSPKGKEAADSP
ncbi:response regulator transcription factor [Paenibacillus puerhi]|uniref:response regulator transcription factor n=1 Tax=Paenibacillus puerhi TaxID=2692622 RepID=UPI00135A062E|nr:response regulator [Paenibacillus puerhi]